MTQSAIATAADYADAMFTARKARNILFTIILLMLLGEVALFFVFRHGLNDQQQRRMDFLKYLVGLIQFLGVVLPIILCVDLLLLAGIMLVGRLIGVSRVVAAFLWCVVLAVLLFPWQAFLENQSFTSTDFKVPGVLYSWAELTARAGAHPAGLSEMILFWGRFVAGPVVAILILLAIQSGSGKGLRQALGETFVEPIQPSPDA